ncbi:MAG: mechanosensitive ion channel family protein [Anaerolinea sp.]|nr:mechanosensitive ion channel family protein [Anaerolinea sp.]
MPLLQNELWGDALQNWLLALLIVIAVIGALRLIEKTIVWRARALARRTQTHADDFVVDLVGRTQSWFLLVIAIYSGSLVLTLPLTAVTILERTVTIALFIQIAIWGQGVITFWVSHYKKQRLAEDANSVTILATLGLIGKLVLWLVILLLILDNLGVEVTSLIAGLGVSGIAVALAVQNILGDLFASLSIVLDKPFIIGDVITVGEFTGTVEKIGLKTTRVRNLSGELVIFSNTDLLTSRIRNFQTLRERRIVFSFGVLYETPPPQLAQVPQIVRDVIDAQQYTRFDRTHFTEFGASALMYEVVYFVLQPDMLTYRNTQHAINLALLEQFAAAGLEFAYPTQTVYVKGER